MMTQPTTTEGTAVLLEGSYRDGAVSAELPLDEIGKWVRRGEIVVLKGVFRAEAEPLLALRRGLFEWASGTPALSEPDPDTNCHCFQAGVSAFQKTPHVYHSYNLNRISQMPAHLAGPLTKYFSALTVFQNAITGHAAELESPGQAPSLHPQLIQYPLGGGMFGRHVHPLEPQRIGLICALSQRGVDFAQGGTCFEVDGAIVDIEEDHEFGDIALFRFDLPHWVNPSALRDKFVWESESGRWSMVLPYN
jgi:hypothetical protein